MNLDYTGVYQIKNLVSNKIYVGSTTQSFITRLKQHVYELETNKHKNAYLQSSWNKHGGAFFEFKILKICPKSMCLKEEQYFMDTLNATDKSKGFNINPLATNGLHLTRESLNKRRESFKETIRKAMVFYKSVKNKELSLEDVPKKYLKLVLAKLNAVPWNKGLTKKETNFDHLKGVKKKKTTKYTEGRVLFSNTQRSKSREILVYNYEGNLIKTFRSISDIVDYTKKEHDLPLVLRTKGKKGNTLSHQNISNVCNNKSKHHKGLIFRYKDSELLVEALKPQDIHPKWTKFKLQCATSSSDAS